MNECPSTIACLFCVDVILFFLVFFLVTHVLCETNKWLQKRKKSENICVDVIQIVINESVNSRSPLHVRNHIFKSKKIYTR